MHCDNAICVPSARTTPLRGKEKKCVSRTTGMADSREDVNNEWLVASGLWLWAMSIPCPFNLGLNITILLTSGKSSRNRWKPKWYRRNMASGLGRPFYIMCYRSRVSIVLGDGAKEERGFHSWSPRRERGFFGKVYEVMEVVRTKQTWGRGKESQHHVDNIFGRSQRRGNGAHGNPIGRVPSGPFN